MALSGLNLYNRVISWARNRVFKSRPGGTDQPTNRTGNPVGISFTSSHYFSNVIQNSRQATSLSLSDIARTPLELRLLAVEEYLSSGEIEDKIFQICSKTAAEQIFSELDDFEKMDIISHALTIAFCSAREKTERAVRQLVVPGSKLASQAAHKLIQSYLSVLGISQPTSVAVTFAMYNEQARLQARSVHSQGEDFLRVKIRQLEALQRINPNFKWQLFVVNDGDDSHPDSVDPFARVKSSDHARQIIQAEYPQYVENITVLEMGQAVREKIGSRKGGAIMYGLHQALKSEARPDYLVYTDADLSTHLGLSGLLLEALKQENIGIACGSSRLEKGAMRKFSLPRFLFSRGFNRFVRMLLPIGTIFDTQLSFKGIPRSVAEEVLPVSAGGEFDPNFYYDMSFDNNLIARVRSIGYEAREVSVVWTWSKNSTLRWYHAWHMVKVGLRARLDLEKWKEQYFVGIRALLNLNAETRLQQLQELVGTEGDRSTACQNIRLLSLKESYVCSGLHLSKNDRVDLLARAYSVALSRSDAEKIVPYIKDLLATRSEALLEEAVILMKSYLFVYGAKQRAKVALVFNSMNSQLALVGEQPNNQLRNDFLRKKIRQLNDLYKINPLFEWRLVIVSGNDANPGHKNPACHLSSAETISGIVEREYPELAASGRVKIVMMGNYEKAFINSKKGGGIVLGMRQAVSDGADYVFYGDEVTLPHQGQQGILLKRLIDNPNEVAVGSRRMVGSLGYRVWFRKLASFVYNKWVWFVLPELRDVADTQAPFKAFSREQLMKILPVSAERKYDPLFDYGLSFDSNLLLRAKRQGYGIAQVPFIDSFEMSAQVSSHPVFKYCKSEMAGGIWRQRMFMKSFNGDYSEVRQGVEALAVGHPTRPEVVKIQREGEQNISVPLLGRILGISSGDQGKNIFEGDPAMSAKANLTVQSLGRLAFSLPVIESLAYSMVASVQGRTDYRRQAEIAEQKLEGLVPNTRIYKNVKISVIAPLGIKTVYYLNRLVALLGNKVKLLVQKAAALLNPLLAVVGPGLAQTFKMIWKGLLPIVRPVIRVIDAVLFHLWPYLGRAASNVWRACEFTINYLGPIVSHLYAKAQEYWDLCLQKIGPPIQEVLDSFPVIERIIFKADVLLRPVIALPIIWLSKLAVWLNSLNKPIILYPRTAVVQEKYQMLGEVLTRLVASSDLAEARKMIDRFIAFEESLWRRGVFDLDSHLLGDFGIDDEGKIVLLDFGGLTTDLSLAQRKLRPETTAESSFHLVLLKNKLLIANPEVGQEVYDYYLARARDSITAERIAGAWNQDKNVSGVIETNPLQPVFVRSSIGEVSEKYERLIDTYYSGQNHFSLGFLGFQDRNVKTAVLVRALQLGMREQRMLAREIICLLGETVGHYLKEPPFNQVEWTVCLGMLPAEVKKVIEDYLSFESAHGTEVLEIFKAAVLTGTENKVKVLFPILSDPTFYSSVIGQRRIVEVVEDRDGQGFLGYERGSEAAEKITCGVNNVGQGKRQGLLSLQYGSKGEIEIFGEKMSNLATNSLGWLNDLLPKGSWFLFVPADTLLLAPTVEEVEVVARQMDPRSSFFYFDQKDRMLLAQEKESAASLTQGALAQLLTSVDAAKHYGPKIITGTMGILGDVQREQLVRGHGGNEFLYSYAVRDSQVYTFLRMRRRMLGGDVGTWGTITAPVKLTQEQWGLLWYQNQTIPKDAWQKHWEDAQLLGKKSIGLGYQGPWLNLNCPQDVYMLYRGAVSWNNPDWCRRVRMTLGLPINRDLANANLKGDIHFTGNHFIRNSLISIPEGARLELGDNVVINDSILEISAKAGEIIRIPDGTVINASRIHGVLAGKGNDGFINGLFSNDGLSFLSERIQATLIFNDGTQVQVDHSNIVTKDPSEYTYLHNSLNGAEQHSLDILFERSLVSSKKIKEKRAKLLSEIASL